MQLIKDIYNNIFGLGNPNIASSLTIILNIFIGVSLYSKGIPGWYITMAIVIFSGVMLFVHILVHDYIKNTKRSTEAYNMLCDEITTINDINELRTLINQKMIVPSKYLSTEISGHKYFPLIKRFKAASSLERINKSLKILEESYITSNPELKAKYLISIIELLIHKISIMEEVFEKLAEEDHDI